jgi:hypothetical protein
MWRRLSRRTFAPNRPAVDSTQVGLLVLSVLAVIVGLVVVFSRF